MTMVVNPHRFVAAVQVPVLQSAVVDEDELVLTYDLALDSGSTPDADDFTVTDDYESQSVTGVVISGTAVTLTLSPGVLNDSVVTVDYVKDLNFIQTPTGGEAAELSAEAVTNDTNITVPAATHAWLNLIAGSDRADSIGSNDATYVAGGGVQNVWAIGDPFGLPAAADTLQFSVLAVFTIDTVDGTGTLLSNINGGTLEGLSITVGAFFGLITPGGAAAGDLTVMVDDGSTDSRQFLYSGGELNSAGDYVVVITYDGGSLNARINQLAAASATSTASGTVANNSSTIGALFSNLAADGGSCSVWQGTVLTDQQMRQLVQDNS